MSQISSEEAGEPSMAENKLEVLITIQSTANEPKFNLLFQKIAEKNTAFFPGNYSRKFGATARWVIGL